MLSLPNRLGRGSIRQSRHGQVLIEFSFIVLILYVLMAVTVDFGRALYSAQIVQQAADVMAREISRTPLPPDYTFLKALGDSNVQSRIYSENFLAIPKSTLGTTSPIDYFDQQNAPIVNKILLPAMVFQDVGGQTWFMYPGRLKDGSTTSGKTVDIPIVDYSSGDDTIVKYVDVVEEIKDSSGAGAFSLLTPIANGQSGLVALRINYPFQAAGMTAFPRNDKTAPVVASDFDGSYDPGPYAGPNGLGVQEAFDKNVRPFRRVISAQAIQRREIFGSN